MQKSCSLCLLLVWLGMWWKFDFLSDCIADILGDTAVVACVVSKSELFTYVYHRNTVGMLLSIDLVSGIYSILEFVWFLPLFVSGLFLEIWVWCKDYSPSSTTQRGREPQTHTETEHDEIRWLEKAMWCKLKTRGEEEVEEKATNDRWYFLIGCLCG